MSQHSMRGAQWDALRLLVLEEELYTCYVCGGEADQVDHLIPVKDAPDLGMDRANLRAICAGDNRAKSDGELLRVPYVNKAWFSGKTRF